MRRVNHNQLYFFHVVAEEKKLSKAAQRLGMAQSTLSEHLRGLERSLRTKLFVRSSQGVSLTEAGRIAYKHTDVMFRASGQLMSELCGEGTVQQTVVVGIASTVSRSLAASMFIPVFQEPDFSVRLRHGDHDYLLQQVLAAESDVLITDVLPRDADRKGILSKTLQAPRMVAIAAPEIAQRVQRFPDDLGQLPYIGYTLHSRYRIEIDDYFDSHDISPNYLGEVDDVIVMARLVERGQCFAIVPSVVLDEEDFEKRTVKVLGTVDGLRSDVYALYVDRDPNDVTVRVLDLLAPTNPE